MSRLLSVGLRTEQDVVDARQRARQVASAVGFDTIDQTRIATAVSELARNAIEHANGGTVECALEGTTSPQLLIFKVIDHGKGVANLDDVLGGRYVSETGMGLGIVGTRRLVDHFDIRSTPTGTTITIKKLLPSRAPLIQKEAIARLTAELAHQRPAGALDEIRQQNLELLRTLDDLRVRQEELERVNHELEDTNRGVVALYAELDERADHLRRADELKTKFLSNMTHEFRTPVNSILALTGLLSERLGSAPDQKDEIFFIRKSAEQLAGIVDDLLDLAKVEAGKIEVRPAPFEIGALFGALRGMLRPLLISQSLALVFEEAEQLPPIFSDESKVSQVLRNFISNALKYTERGEVRVTAALGPSRDTVIFSVADTGIGIPERDLQRVFDEFVQIENPLQQRTKGTGLGLPLSKRLAELLGGSVSVRSALGVGSVFSLSIPLVYRDPIGHLQVGSLQPGRAAVLVIEDNDADMTMYERALAGTRFQLVPARSLSAARAALDALRPGAIILDIRLFGEDSWHLLAKLKRDPVTRAIPIIVISTFDDQQKGLALGADAYAVKPIQKEWLLHTLERVLETRGVLRVVAIDDEEAYRFIISEMLDDPRFDVTVTATAADGLRAAREIRPDVVLLDLELDDMDGIELRGHLRSDDATADIPVVVVTSHRVTEEQRRRLGHAGAILSKAQLTRDVLRSAILETVAPNDPERPSISS
jgi:signal transduction histidine kinase/DNA-binding response OmpR family regulator